MRRIVSEALTYLQNQSGKMNSPQYRQQGLPITSSHIESTVKLLNHRVKGSEKFWSESGAEALLQLKADTLSETGHWETFWHTRPTTMTGTQNLSLQQNLISKITNPVSHPRGVTPSRTGRCNVPATGKKDFRQKAQKHLGSEYSISPRIPLRISGSSFPSSVPNPPQVPPAQ